MLAAASAAVTLTYLTRIAQRRKDARKWLAGAFAGRLEKLAEPALEVAIETGEPLGEVLAEAVEREGSIVLAERLARDLVDDDRFNAAWPLRRLAITVNALVLGHLRTAWPEPESEQRARIAALAHNLGRAQKDLGHWHEARASFEEALHHYRHLGQLFHLAVALNNFGALLSLLGHLDQALEALREAVTLSRAPAGNRTGDLDLAGALVNLCGCLSDLDRPPEALEAIEDAVDLYRPYQDRLDDFESHRFASALICLGNQLDVLGRYEAALGALQEGVALRQRLASDWPTSFEPDLALALANLARLLDRLHRDGEAAETLDRALRLFRQAAGQHRAAFEPDLAWALSLGVRETGSSASRLEKAVELAEEAVALLRRLAAEQPTAFGPRLARGLNTLSFARESAGDFEEALLASGETISLIGPKPSRHQQRDLAWGLIHRCRALGALGRWREALEDARKAVKLLPRRRTQRGEIALERATASHELGICLAQAGRFREAAEATESAVAIFRQLAQTQSAVFLGDLAGALNSLGNHQHALGQLEDALATSREAVELCRRVGHQRGASFDPILAASLNNLALRHYQLGRPEEALGPAGEALVLYRAAGSGPVDRKDLAECLHNLGTVLDALGQEPQALEHFEEAVELRRALLSQTTDAGTGVDLARSLTNLGKILDHDEARAIRVTSEAVSLFRRAVEEGLEFLRPQLAMALSHLAHQMANQGRWHESVATAEEAVRLLLPSFLERPADFRAWTALALGHYLKAAEEAGVEVDWDLLTTIAVEMGALAENE